MKRIEKAPFVPTEFHIGTVTSKTGLLGILTIQTTEGCLDVALDRQAADAIISAINKIRARLDENNGN